MGEPTARQFIGIGPLAEALGVSTSLIRKLEAQGTLPPSARLGGSARRIYRVEDIELLREQTARRRDRRQTAIAR